MSLFTLPRSSALRVYNQHMSTFRSAVDYYYYTP